MSEVNTNTNTATTTNPHPPEYYSILKDCYNLYTCEYRLPCGWCKELKAPCVKDAPVITYATMSAGENTAEISHVGYTPSQMGYDK